MNSKECRIKIIELENALKILFPKERIESVIENSLFVEDIEFKFNINDYIPNHLYKGSLLDDLSRPEKYKGIDPVEEFVIYYAYEYLQSIGNPDTDRTPPFIEDIRNCHRAKKPLEHKCYLEVKAIMDRTKIFKDK